MKTCQTCKKKFGFFEKIYESEDGNAYCQECVKLNEPIKEECVNLNNVNEEVSSNTYVTLPDSNIQTRVDVSKNIPIKEKWEFRVIKLSIDTSEKRRNISVEMIEKVINKMGNDGWELVSVLPLNTLLMSRDKLDQPAMIFKRRQ